jgi:mannose-6-phosphate isomerase-like protein (cupin superfamily)
MSAIDLFRQARENGNFRAVLETGDHAQLVVMTIEPGGEIGEETHEGDQLLVFIEGDGEAIIDGKPFPVAAEQAVFVPAGTLHNFRATGSGPLRIVTVYAPPEHAPGTVHATKADADADEHDH